MRRAEVSPDAPPSNVCGQTTSITLFTTQRWWGSLAMPALFAVSSWRKVSTGAEGPRPAPGRSGAKRQAKKSVSDRFEDRWRKRREGGQ